MLITHSEHNIWNGPIVAIALSQKKRKSVLEASGHRQHLLHLATLVTRPDSV